MPTNNAGLEKIQKWMEAEGINAIDLGTTYGIARPKMYDILKGKDDTVKANQVILQIIKDFRIR